MFRNPLLFLLGFFFAPFLLEARAADMRSKIDNCQDSQDRACVFEILRDLAVLCGDRRNSECECVLDLGNTRGKDNAREKYLLKQSGQLVSVFYVESNNRANALEACNRELRRICNE